MSLPIVAVVGRPNVGKSTLINRIASKRMAITHEFPGVTRDRKYIEVEWFDKNFLVVDTGGFEFEKNQSLSSQIADQAKMAIDDADAIVFVVDAKEGLHPFDEEISTILRKTKKKIYLTANKIDTEDKKVNAAEFYKLGFEKVYEVSASHGEGVSELFDEVVDSLPLVKVQSFERTAVAIVGRPNVGKSSLLNKLLGEERVIVSDIAGTTRDTIDSIVSFDKKEYRFIDTAGINRKKAVDIEYFGLVRALEALDKADIALIMVDAKQSIVDQDLKIIDYAVSRGCGVIIILNKWDLIKEEESEMLRKEVMRKLHYIAYTPILDISVKTGRKLNKIFEQIQIVEEGYSKEIKTKALNDFVRDLDTDMLPSKYKIRIGYASQISSKPPKFLFFISPKKAIKDNLKRFIESKLRSRFDLIGTPVKILFKEK